jgi:hypothetical protein
VEIKVAPRAVGQEAITFDDWLEEVTYSYHDYRRIILGTDISGWILNIAARDTETDSCLVQCLAPGTARVQITLDQRRSPNAILHRTVTWVSSGPHAAFTPFHGYKASSS